MARVLVGDYSDYQYGADLDTVAQSIPAAFFKVFDWSYWAGHGTKDWLHDDGLRAFRRQGKPASSYCFPRPGWTDPKTQVDTWVSQVDRSLVTMSPMSDLEVPGTLTGASLTAWADEFLYWTTDRFERKPTQYWSASFASAHGMGPLTTPHFNMVAEYHLGYRTLYWADRGSWESMLYAVYGGPDLPPGETSVDIWQGTSSAQVPGFPGLTDMSLADPAVFAEMTGDAIDPEELTVADIAALQAQIEAVRVNILTDMGTYINSVYTAVARAEDEIEAELGRVRDFIVAALPHGAPGGPNGVPVETVRSAVDKLGQVTTGLQQALPAADKDTR